MSELFIVATPIGNLQDITLRALDILKSCDAIICEDTRITTRLLEKYEIKNKKLLTYNDNSNESSRQKIAKLLEEVASIALVSDAGTPLISDPGYKLIQYLQEKKIKITPIPGPSSLTAAICASGIACDNFLFIGFLPTSKIQRQNYLKTLPFEYSLVFFEAANRLIETLQDLQVIFGDRKMAIAREITKIHEEIKNDKISQLIAYFNQNLDKIKGEVVIILEKALKSEKSLSLDELDEKIKKSLILGEKIGDLSKNLAQIYKIHKKEVYSRALEIQQKLQKDSKK